MMIIQIKLLTCFIGFLSVTRSEIILTEDKPYDVIDIKIPKSIWLEALHPTPILKSQATIVVPVHVSQENNIEEDTYDDVSDLETSTVLNSEPVEAGSITPTSVNSTQRPVQEDEVTTAAQEVTGQVTRFPCSCQGQCGCCTGAILQRFNMKACGNITFIPEDFVFDVRLTVNNSTVVRQRVSASDPPPICFNPRRAPFVRVCAEISNIRIRNRNAFACLDINADIGGFPVYSASFRCFGLGASGVQTGLKPKPASSGPAPVSLFGNQEEGGFIENAAGAVLGDGGLFGGGGDGGLFGGGGDGGIFGGGGGDGDNGGPLDGIGDVVGDFLDGRNMKL